MQPPETATIRPKEHTDHTYAQGRTTTSHPMSALCCFWGNGTVAPKPWFDTVRSDGLTIFAQGQPVLRKRWADQTGTEIKHDAEKGTEFGNIDQMANNVFRDNPLLEIDK